MKKQSKIAYFFLAPALLAIFIFFFVPVLAAFIISFSDFDIYSLGNFSNARLIGLKNYSVENVLTEIPPFRNENADMIYLLPNRFVKGYINHQTGEIFSNPDYNPFYDTPVFEKNLAMMKSSQAN